MNSSTEQAEFSPPADEVGEAWENIPEELRALPQWVVAGRDKSPRDAQDLRRRIDAFEPTNWSIFDDARSKAAKAGLHIGFVLTEDDPYTIIDLDDKPDNPASEEGRKRYQKIIETFDSYTERSTSGRGYHIIIEGAIPEGKRRDKVEVYSSKRFMICTGDSFHVSPKPIAERQDLLDTLFHEMGGNLNGTAKVQVDDQEAKDSDEQILQWAMNADNAANFRPLWEGVWEGKYGSQSEADMALMSMLRFYTKNVDQLFRLFRQSGLGKRGKAQKNDTYLTHTLNSVVRSEPPLVDFSRFFWEVKSKEETQPIKDRMQPISVSELFNMEFGELRWNVEGILPAGTMLLFGKPKKGKSFLILLAAISIAARRPVFGRQTSGAHVLYLGLEDSLRRLQRRAKSCAFSLGIDTNEFANRLHVDVKSGRIDTGLLDELHAWMKTYPETGVIVIDMLKKITGAGSNKQSLYEEQSKVGDTLTKFCHQYPSLSIIVVHHSRKAESDDPFDLVSGTTGLSGSYDNLAAIAETEGARVLHLTGRDIEGAEIPLLMNDHGMYTLEMPAPDQQATATMSDTRRRVYDAVPDSVPISRRDVIVHTRLGYGVVDQQLNKLKRDGLIKIVERGRYQKTGTRWFEEAVLDLDAVMRNASRL